jgi:hypothetical protein
MSKNQTLFVVFHEWRINKETAMRVMVIVKANSQSEAGVMPPTDMFAKMGAYNEELAKAGLLLAGEGLHPSTKGARVIFDQGKTRVVDGPFTETKELIAGFWLWQVKSLEEAVEWGRRMPQVPGSEQNLEIRQVLEADDFGDALTPELRENEARLRAQSERRV